MRAVLKSMSRQQHAAASARAQALLEQQAAWRNAQSVLFYAPLPEELDVWPLAESALSAGKTVALPRFVPRKKIYAAGAIRSAASDLAIGQFGIQEPADHCSELPLNRLDLVLVPGVAFDLHGRRLGRGKGFYDQLLAAVRGTTCGVAFDEQIVSEIPVEPHDIHLNCILTPTRWIEL
jgi:5-formyltetrahydrofolate cyclo-ligase